MTLKPDLNPSEGPPTAASPLVRLVLIVPSYYPDVRGGGERQATLQAETLARSGFEVSLLAPTLSREMRGWSPASFGRILRFPLRAFPARGGRYLSSTLRWTASIALWLLHNRTEFDLIYVFHGRLHVLGPLIGARLAKRPIVVKIGGGGIGSDFNALRRKKLFYGRWVVRALINWTTRFVAVSQTITEDLRKEKIDQSRILQISNGVIVPTKEDITAALTRRSGKRMIFPTRLVDDKGIEVLIHALQRVTDQAYELTLLGDGPDKARFEALAETLGVARRVHFMSSVEDVYPLLLQHDIFLSASVREGQSNALLEAIACGLIPIVAPASGVADVIDHGQTGFVVGQVTASAFAEEINRVSAFNEEERAAFAWRLHAHAQQEFGIDVIGARLAAAFPTLVQSAQ